MLDALARWATGARDLPADVLDRAKLLHLSMAGAVRRAHALPLGQEARRGASPGPAPLVGAPARLAPRDAVRVHAALLAGQDFADTVFNSPAALGAVCASWALGQTAADQLLATAVAVEVAARVGAAGLLATTQGDAWGCVHALSAAVAAAKLQGLDERAMGHAMALALSGASVIPRETLFGPAAARGLAVAREVLQGIDAADQARGGATGPADVLERHTFPEIGCALPLLRALEPPGEAWFIRATVFKPIPGANSVQVPVQAVHEILRRHVRAAEKRLRTDQVERIALRVAAPGWAGEQLTPPGWDPGLITRSIARSVAALITAHELGSPQLDPAWLENQAEVLTDLAARVELRHSWALTADGLAHLAEVAAPLFAGLGARAVARAMRAQGGGWPALPLPAGPGDLVELAKAHPERLLLARADGPFQPERWRCPQRVEVKLYTTRGGWWPERRDTPDGLGWPPEKLQRMLEAKWAGDGPGPAPLDPSASAEGWLAALGG